MLKTSGSEDDQTIKADEFMKMLKISANTLKKLLAEGRVPMPLPLGSRNRRWSRAVVMGFLNKPDNYNINTNSKA
jgi:predicted DNA-binding transcriptional regulator AlpA